MLARLRREFIAITMALVGIVLVGVLGSSLLSNYLTQHDVTSDALERALNGDVTGAKFGDISGERGPEFTLAITIDLFWDGTTGYRSNSPLSIPDETLENVLAEVLRSEQDSGESAEYPISWMRARLVSDDLAGTELGYRVALVDTYTRDSVLRTQAINSLVIFAVSMAVLYVVAHQLSGWVLRPVERAWEQQRRFVSDASHELKTPLAVILANAQILEGEKDLPDEAAQWVRSTSEEAKHMRGLVEDLLTLARADEQEAAGRRSPLEREFDLSELVSGCSLEFDAVAFERGCSIECELEPGVRVVADPDQMGRAVRTLLDNATKYADRGTPVLVRLVRDRRNARLTVNNRGEAISPEDLEHLFDRFYRTDDARERQQDGGFGLGLAIAKSIVEAAGGKIFATSTADEGTTFTIELHLPRQRA